MPVCVLLVHALIGLTACDGNQMAESPAHDPNRERERHRMVGAHVVPSGVRNPAVLRAMRQVPRHRFVPARYSALAYEDGPLPLGYDQTISQPSLVALMTEALSVKKTDKVLEVGTGSGYQAAILAELASEVLTIEIVEPLARQAEATLAELGYRNIRVRVGDGYQGWPEEAPYDAIMVTAAPDHVPQPLLEQLAVGGRLILPVGRHFQTLELYRRTAEGYERETITHVRFVPLVREGRGQ